MKLFVAQTIDGFITGPDGSLDHLKPFEQNDYGYDAFLETVDAVVLGRTTFDSVYPEHGWAYPEHMAGVVVTSHPLPEDVPGHVRPSGDLTEIADTYPNAFIDGGALTIAGFMQIGAVTEATIFTLPTTVGEGVRLFGAGRHRPADWQLETTRPFPCGTVMCRYRVVAQ